MHIITERTFDEERALYGLRGAEVTNCRFDGPADGESALKECRDVRVKDCFFNLRYPLWHAEGATLTGCELTEKCRAALWYDRDVTLENCRLDGIKALRECGGVTLKGCEAVSPELLWKCRDVRIEDCRLTSEYLLLEGEGLTVDRLTMAGKYSFQYVKGATIAHAELNTKDAFWHAEDVTVTDSVIRGEYLGWYSRNLRLIRCRIIGTQPLCYCRGLVLEDCVMEDTDRAFERSEVTATVKGAIVSVKNPAPDSAIRADAIGELILEPAYCDPGAVTVDCPAIGQRSE